MNVNMLHNCAAIASPRVCVLTEPLPVGLDLWSKAVYFPLELLFGFINQFTVLGDNLCF